MLTIKFPLNFVEDAVTYLDHSPRAVRPHLTGALHFHVNTDTGRIKMIATNGHIAGLWCIDNAKPDSRANYTGSDFIANLIKLDPEGISDNDYKPVELVTFSALIRARITKNSSSSLINHRGE